MQKLSAAVAVTAMLTAFSAPSFAADVNTSTSQSHQSTVSQDRNDVNGKTSVERKTEQNFSSSKSKDTGVTDRDQSAQMPNNDKDSTPMVSPGRSSAAPGHEMQEKGSIPAHPGASGYAPGQVGK